MHGITWCWMACCATNSQAAGPSLAGLLCSETAHLTAELQLLSGLVQENKEQLVEKVLRDNTDGYFRVLAELLSSPDSWKCNTAASLLEALLEREDFVQKLKETRGGSDELVSVLGRLLIKDNLDTATNVTSAIASLAGSGAGRELLQQDDVVFCQVLTGLSALLRQGTEGTVNCAALALARLSLNEATCHRLLSLPCAPATLRSLAACLAQSHTDTAMNAAVALGHLCVTENGRALILESAQEHGLVSGLQALLCDRTGPGARQTACFALSCLVSEADGHALVLRSSTFPRLLDGLSSSLLEEEPDSAWFAAVVVRVLVSRPSGVVRVREHRHLEDRLRTLCSSWSLGQELQEEVSGCLRKLQRLPKPPPPTTNCLTSGSYMVSWEKYTPESGLEVTYSLLDKDTLLYRGTQCYVTLPLSTLQSELTHSLCIIHSTIDNDISPSSEPTLLAVEREGAELMPSQPQQLHVIGCTETQVKLSWATPESGLKPKSYQLYRGETLLGTTTEHRAIVGGLSPGTLYRLGVRALGPGVVAGPAAWVEARTSEGQDHAPSRLTVTVLGRHELQVSWGAPALPLGRLFNYELRLNGRVAYLGTERAYTARRLATDTAYTCTVAAITSKGRCQSRPVTKRTACDGYLRTQRCLYPPPHAALSGEPALPRSDKKFKEHAMPGGVLGVREKVKKPRDPRGPVPETHPILRRHNEMDSDQNKQRRSVTSQGHESSQTPRRTFEDFRGSVLLGKHPGRDRLCHPSHSVFGSGSTRGADPEGQAGVSPRVRAEPLLFGRLDWTQP